MISKKLKSLRKKYFNLLIDPKMDDENKRYLIFLIYFNIARVTTINPYSYRYLLKALSRTKV